MPPDEELKQILASNVKKLVDEVENLKSVINQTLSLLIIDSNELSVYYSLLSLPKSKFENEFYRALSKNPLDIHKLVSGLNNEKIEFAYQK